MQLKEMTIWDVISRGVKKAIIEITSVKFWGTCFVGYLNYRIVIETKAFDLFGIICFLTLLGIREAKDLLDKKL